MRDDDDGDGGEQGSDENRLQTLIVCKGDESSNCFREKIMEKMPALTGIQGNRDRDPIYD